MSNIAGGIERRREDGAHPPAAFASLRSWRPDAAARIMVYTWSDFRLRFGFDKGAGCERVGCGVHSCMPRIAHRTKLKTREMETRHASSANQTYETIITNAKAGMEGLTAKEKEHIKQVSHAGGCTHAAISKWSACMLTYWVTATLFHGCPLPVTLTSTFYADNP